MEKLMRNDMKSRTIIGILGILTMVSIVGVGIRYGLDNKNMSFEKWLKIAPKKELEDAYEKLRLEFISNSHKPIEMKLINNELAERGAKEWFEKHTPNLNPNFRWTDANRWDKD